MLTWKNPNDIPKKNHKTTSFCKKHHSLYILTWRSVKQLQWLIAELIRKTSFFCHPVRHNESQTFSEIAFEFLDFYGPTIQRVIFQNIHCSLKKCWIYFYLSINPKKILWFDRNSTFIVSLKVNVNKESKTCTISVKSQCHFFVNWRK